MDDILKHHKIKLSDCYQATGLSFAEPPLHYALRRSGGEHDQLQTVKTLVKHKADPNTPGHNDERALHLAQSAAVVKLLVESKVCGCCCGVPVLRFCC